MPFKKGRSGNPSGRKKGVEDRRTRFRQLAEPHAPALLKKAIDMALSGNEPMLRLILDRLLPARPKDETVSIGPYCGNHRRQSDQILDALYKGEITPTEANALMSATISALKIAEMEELEQRLTHLEDRL